MLLAILAAYFGYKKADESGRNGLLWAAICAGAFIGTQLAVGILVAAGIGIGIVAFGWDESILETWGTPVNLIAIVASILVVWILFRHLDRIPESEPEMAVPPPPEFAHHPESELDNKSEMR